MNGDPVDTTSKAARSREGHLVVGLGESLFDVLPEGPVLGGAPLNAAVHADQLLKSAGGRGIVATRVGTDDLGRRLLRELRDRGVRTDWIQTTDSAATGRAFVDVVDGEPHFQIVEGAAWDALEFTEQWRSLAGACAAVCFGTLGQRSPASRQTIQRFLEEATQAIRLFDVNLRQSFYSEGVIRRSCALATIVKLNELEAPRLATVLGLPLVEPEEVSASLLRTFALDAVVLTRGAKGTTLFTSAGPERGAAVQYARDPRADTVGAGDACSAAVVTGWILGWPARRIVALANHCGAFVASRPGATPTLPDTILAMVQEPV